MELERKIKAKRSRGDYYENNEEEDSVQIKFKRLLGKLTTYVQVTIAHIGESLFTLFASLRYAYHYLMTLINKNSEY